jgi:hypothetical protein
MASAIRCAVTMLGAAGGAPEDELDDDDAPAPPPWLKHPPQARDVLGVNVMCAAAANAAGTRKHLSHPMVRMSSPGPRVGVVAALEHTAGCNAHATRVVRHVLDGDAGDEDVNAGRVTKAALSGCRRALGETRGSRAP